MELRHAIATLNVNMLMNKNIRDKNKVLTCHSPLSLNEEGTKTRDNHQYLKKMKKRRRRTWRKKKKKRYGTGGGGRRRRQDKEGKKEAGKNVGG